MKKIILILFSSVFCIEVHASKDLEFANKASLSVAAFSCHAYYSYANKSNESYRLFEIGYKSGKDFLTYIKGNKMDEKILDEEVPSVFLYENGPTVDFMLGSIYSQVIRTALDQVLKNSNLSFEYDEELRKQKADSLIRERNCALLK